MMSSVIPARLQFQCGHAAMVTLPKVKGESSAQRNERIAREKSAALARQCDFCGPTVAVAAPTLAEEINGSHMTTAEIMAAEPIAVETGAPESEPQPLVPVAVVEVEAVMSEEPVETIVVAGLEPAEEPEEAVVIVEPVVLVEQVILGVEAESPAPRRANGAVTRRRRASQPAPTSRAQTWAVTYTAKQVVRAATIHEALRKASALGASELLSITRES
jgi:hypothetical protein